MKTVNLQFVLHWVWVGRLGQDKDSSQYLIIDFSFSSWRLWGLLWAWGREGGGSEVSRGQAGRVSARLELILKPRMGT